MSHLEWYKYKLNGLFCFYVNLQITRPSASRYIRFYDSSNNQNVYSFDVTSPSATFPTAGSGGQTITFSFSFNFVAGASYYVLLDSGE